MVNRDFDLVVDRDQYMQPLKDCMFEQADWLEDVLVFDVYSGDPLPEDKKSISFTMKFRHPERTLDRNEINDIQENLFETLNENFDAELRES
ncbi:MAG: hypothetical protein ABEK50_11720 [bacterium]